MEIVPTTLENMNYRTDDYEPSIAESRAQSVYSQLPLHNLKTFFSSYQPQHSVIDIQRLKDSPYLGMKRFKEAVYYGEVINGQRHGSGIMIYNNGRLYEGQWEADCKNGKGFQKMLNGCTYEGYYVNSKPEGVGKHSWPSGQFYEGEWLNGLKHGSGMWKGVKGDSYIGEWKLGKADGYGVHTWVNGDRYEGQFKQCLKHGEGVEKFKSGDLYKGQYFQNKPHGFGEYFWLNGSYFKGNFKGGLRHGHGVWKKCKGVSDKYEGEYNEDCKDGYGIFTWAQGNVYKGNYVKDLRSGYGEMYWSDGSYYKGEWRGGVQNGEGVIFVLGEGSKRGLFKDNVLIETHEVIQSANKLDRCPSIKADSTNSRVTWSVDGHVKRIPIPENRYSHKLTGQIRSKPLAPSAKDELRMFPISHQTLDNKAKKDRIPHSAFYLHKMHRKIETASKTREERQHSRLENEEASAVQEMKQFTRQKINNGKMFVSKTYKRY